MYWGNGAAWYTTYSYNALGRQIGTSNVSTSNVVISATQTYYDGANPIEVRMANNSLLAAYVWSPADGRMILRDAVALALSSYTGLSISANTTGGVIQRLYPLTDGTGSIVAVASPSIPVGTPASNYVQERYVYTADGLPQALNRDFTARTLGTVWQFASTLGWNWLYRGQQWVQVSPDSQYFQWRGLYVSAAGVWSDPVHGTTLQPDLTDYGVPQSNPYQMSAEEQFGARVAPMVLGLGIAVLTGGIGAPVALAAALGGVAACGFGAYAAGGDAEQVAVSAAVGGIAGMMGGAAGELAGAGAGLLSQTLGLTCSNGLGMIGGLLMGSAEGAAFSGTEAFVRTGLMTGSAVDAVMAGWNGLETGAALGGALGAIFHEVCFASGTQVVLEILIAGTAGLRADGVSLAQGSVGTLNSVRYRTRAVERVRKGDIIASRDENDPYGPIVYRRVTEVYRRLADHLRILQIRDFAGREQVIRTTDEHPFKTADGRWTSAKNLAVGDVFFGPDGTSGVLLATTREEHPEGIEVFNFQVEGTHTYFVRGEGSDAEPVWVHNSCRVAYLDPGEGWVPAGPALGRAEAIEAGLSGEDLAAGSQSEALDVAKEISGGEQPIYEVDQYGPHYHPAGRNPNIHIFWQR